MFFASRHALPAVSAELHAAQAGLLQRNYSRAWREAGIAAAAVWTLLPGNALLAAEVARGSGYERRYRAIVRLARRRWPRDPHVFLEWLRQAAGPERAMADLDARLAAGEFPGVLRALADAVAAAAWARRDSPIRARERAAHCDEAAATDPRVAYELGHAWIALRDWDAAALMLRQAVRLAPDWPRARASLAHALMAAGAHAEAAATLQQGAQGLRDEPSDYAAVFQLQAAHDIAGSYRAARSYLDRWPDSDAQAAVAAWAFQAACLLGEHQAARDAAAAATWLGDDRRVGIEPALAGRRALLPLQPLRQGRRQCVAAVGAMVAAWHGDAIEPRALYTTLGGVEGLDLWRLRAYFEERGYRAEYVRMAPSPLRALIDRGLPVIGVIDTLFASHVDVVCGYDAGSGLFYRRDPDSWPLAWCTDSELDGIYGPAGGVGLALVPPQRRDEEFDPAWRHADALHLDLLRQACANGDWEAAAHYYARIADDSPLALQRSQVAHGIVEPPAAFGGKLLRVVENTRLPALVRARALSMTGDPRLYARHKHALLAQLPGRAAACLLEGAEHAAAQRWPQARDAFAWLTRRCPQQAQLWLRLAQAGFRAGDDDGARYAARRALEASPNSVYVAARVAELFPDMDGRVERVRRWRRLRRRQPGSYAAALAEADARECGRQGPAYGKALRRCIAHAPLEARHYDKLAKWYLAHGLPQHARAVLGEARERLEATLALREAVTAGLSPYRRERFESWVRGLHGQRGTQAAATAASAYSYPHWTELGDSTAVALAAVLYLDHGDVGAARNLLGSHRPADDVEGPAVWRPRRAGARRP